MKCEECQILIEESVDGVLDRQAAALVESHTASCAECANFYSELSREQEIYARYQREIEVTPLMWSTIEQVWVAQASALGAPERMRTVYLVDAASADRQPVPEVPRPRLPVLIIDDSLTTRMLEQSILESAGYDPIEMANMFRTIEQQGGGGGPEWLSDHPNPGNRIEYITAEARSRGENDFLKSRLLGNARESLPSPRLRSSAVGSFFFGPKLTANRRIR